MDASIVLNLLVPVLIALAVASRGLWVDEMYVARWASSAGLELTEATRPTVTRYLTWSRRSRTGGGLIGFLAPIVYIQVTHGFGAVPDSDSGGTSVVLMFAGYLLGAVVAELVVNRPSGSTGLVMAGSRRLRDYLSRYLVITQRSLGILCPVLVAAYVVLAPLSGTPEPHPSFIALFGSVGVAVALVVEALERWIIGRRQPDSTAEELAMYDAMRSSSVHVVSGAGIALLIFFTTTLAAGVLTLVESSAGVISFALILLMFPLSLFFWLDSGKPHGFRVRHPRRARNTHQ